MTGALYFEEQVETMELQGTMNDGITLRFVVTVIESGVQLSFEWIHHVSADTIETTFAPIPAMFSAWKEEIKADFDAVAKEKIDEAFDQFYVKNNLNSHSQKI